MVTPPLSDETRQTIYKLFKADPTKWTPRALSDQFGISIARTEAILRLKSLQQKMIDEVSYPRAPDKSLIWIGRCTTDRIC